jgi:hypothetical protein
LQQAIKYSAISVYKNKNLIRAKVKIKNPFTDG